MNYWKVFLNIIPRWDWCDDCQGFHPRMDAQLPDGTPVTVLQSDVGFHVHVGAMPAEGLPLPRVDEHDVMNEIGKQWLLIHAQ